MEPAIALTQRLFGPMRDVSGPVGSLLRQLTSQRQLAGMAGWSVLAMMVARGANLAAIALCARLLPQSGFGQVALIQSTVGMFAPLAGLGLAMTTTKFLAENRDAHPERAGRILTLSLLAALLAGSLMTIALIVLAPVIAARGLAMPDLQNNLALSSGLLVLGVVESVAGGALAGLSAFSRLAWAGATAGLLSIPAVAVLASTGGATGAIIGLTVAGGLACAANFVALYRECRQWRIRLFSSSFWREWRLLFGFSLPSYLSGILVAPVAWIGNATLIRQPDGLAQVALFSAADRYRFLLIFIPLAVSRIAVPALSRFRAAGDHDGYNAALRWNILAGLVTTALPAALIAAFSRPLMLVFGETFVPGWPVLAMLALSAVPTVLNTQLGAALLSDGRPWARAAVDVFLAVAFFGAAQWAVPRFNALGLAMAFAVSYSAACLMLWACVRGERR